MFHVNHRPRWCSSAASPRLPIRPPFHVKHVAPPGSQFLSPHVAAFHVKPAPGRGAAGPTRAQPTMGLQRPTGHSRPWGCSGQPGTAGHRGAPGHRGQSAIAGAAGHHEHGRPTRAQPTIAGQRANTSCGPIQGSGPSQAQPAITGTAGQHGQRAAMSAASHLVCSRPSRTPPHALSCETMSLARRPVSSVACGSVPRETHTRQGAAGQHEHSSPSRGSGPTPAQPTMGLQRPSRAQRPAMS
jgi:hypothetical protein